MVEKSANSWNRFSLTPYGQSLVADNIRLAHAFSGRVRCPVGIDRDEYEAECIAALCRSAGLFNAGLGHQFSTFAWKGMELWRKELIRRSVKNSRLQFRSPENYLFKIIPDDSRNERNLDDDEIFQRLIERTEGVHDGALLLRSSRGAGIRQIATEMGLSKERIRQRIQRATERVRATM